jgi:succinate dehydrogenase / fumarate reductase iron-sulfur subunit
MLLPMRQEGIIGAIKRAPFGIKMMFKGKVNYADFFGGHKIKRLDEIKVIYEKAQEKKKEIHIKLPQIMGVIYEDKRKTAKRANFAETGGNQ